MEKNETTEGGNDNNMPTMRSFLLAMMTCQELPREWLGLDRTKRKGKELMDPPRILLLLLLISIALFVLVLGFQSLSIELACFALVLLLLYNERCFNGIEQRRSREGGSCSCESVVAENCLMSGSVSVVPSTRARN
ncbi:hypothetical protein FH972_019624 [Carpinus fangiana]|uniref:Uncharacterized protein n=1 Tax=Carpinus fangiana TaxID=176857 RepID=A0A5N6RQT7_9ROSI|nr:hypothetical protein FH972_019624 [Carpinus fangiana]